MADEVDEETEILLDFKYSLKWPEEDSSEKITLEWERVEVSALSWNDLDRAELTTLVGLWVLLEDLGHQGYCAQGTRLLQAQDHQQAQKEPPSCDC